MTSTLKINIVTTGNYITPPDDMIEYMPKQMSNAADNTIYFLDKILITPEILQAADFKQEEYKNVFTSAALFKKLMDIIQEKYDMIEMSNAETFLNKEKFDKENKLLIDKLFEEKEEKTITQEDFIKRIYNIKKKYIIKKNIKFLLDVFFSKKSIFNIEKYKAIINEYRYLSETIKQITSARLEYVVNIQLSLLNPTTNGLISPTDSDFKKLDCIEKSIELENEINELFKYQLSLYPKPNQIMLNKYKLTDEYKNRIKLEKEMKTKLNMEKAERERKAKELKEIEELSNLKRKYELEQLRQKLQPANIRGGSSKNKSKRKRSRSRSKRSRSKHKRSRSKHKRSRSKRSRSKRKHKSKQSKRRSKRKHN